MEMGISSGVTGTNFAPAPEFSQIHQVRPTDQRTVANQKVAIDKFISSLPGKDGISTAKLAEIQRMATEIEQGSRAFFNKKLQFVVDPRSQEVTVEVIDKNTDKVIKVLPPEELRRLHTKLKETIGLLCNEKV